MNYRSRFDFTEEYDWRYSKRLSLPDDKLGNGFNVAWTADIVSINGAHYHFWFPRVDGEHLKKLKEDSKYHASHQGDPVSFSWSWIPENICCPKCGCTDTQQEWESRICNGCNFRWRK